MSVPETDLETLQARWKEMFQRTLPKAVISKSPSQLRWPVHVDHCFARIILDSTVGIDAPWMSKIKTPAYKNMSKEQLEASIALGQKILDGEVDLVELDDFSLEIRGKGRKGIGRASGKRTRAGDEEAENPDDEMEKEKDKNKEMKRVKLNHSPSKLTSDGEEPKSPPKQPSLNKTEDLGPYFKKIVLSDRTNFQKRVLSALCQVPRGKYSTYGAIAKHLSSSPRAVGNALRNNPFAPMVPCHRILASGGGLGGFQGSWGRKGEGGLHDDKKRNLLREEGVRFDGKGKVVGAPWEAFK